MTPQQASQRGIEAQRILDSEVFKEASAAMKAQIVSQWKDCPVRDKEGALLLLQLAKLADKFESVLTSFVQHGNLAQHSISIDEQRDESPVRQYFRKLA